MVLILVIINPEYILSVSECDVFLSMYIAVFFLFISLSIRLSVYPRLYAIYLRVYLSIYLCFNLSICLSLSLSLSLCIYIYIYVCVCVCVYSKNTGTKKTLYMKYIQPTSSGKVFDMQRLVLDVNRIYRSHIAYDLYSVSICHDPASSHAY